TSGGSPAPSTPSGASATGPSAESSRRRCSTPRCPSAGRTSSKVTEPEDGEAERRGPEDEASAAGPSQPPPTPLRHNRNFQMLWIGQVLSDLGSGFGALAYPLLILALTHSPVIAGAVGTITSGAAFVTRLPAGSLADRLDRRR